MTQGQEDIQAYLASQWNNIANPTVKQTVINQAGAKLGELSQQIEGDQLHISEFPKNIQLRPPAPPPQVSLDDRLKEIMHKKEEMMKRLSQMAIEEFKLKQKTHQSHVQLHKPKSQITAEDLQTLKALNHSYRSFERELERKTKELEEKQKQFKLEEKQLEESHKNEASKAKREEIMTKLQAIRRRQQERQQKNLEDQKALSELRNKRALYQQWHEKYVTQQLEQEKRKEQMQEQSRKLKETDFESIKEHKRKYEEMLARQRQERAQKLLEFRKAFEDKTEKYPESKFLSVIKHEQMERHEQTQSRSMLPKLNLQKRVKYAERVKNEIMPTMKLRKQQEEEDTPKKKQQIRSMSVNELLQKGNEYMKIAKGLVRKKPEDQTLNKTEQAPAPAPQQVFKHKNYLADLKMNRTGRQRTQLEKVRAIMDSEEIDQDKLFQAKMLASKMEKSAGNNSKKLMDSIQAKIQILNKLG